MIFKSIILLIFCCLSLIGISQRMEYDTTIAIVKKPLKDRIYKADDIEVIHTNDMYYIYHYWMDQDTLRSLRVGVMGATNLDSAGINWNVDSYIAIRLFGQKKGNHADVKIKPHLNPE